MKMSLSIQNFEKILEIDRDMRKQKGYLGMMKICLRSL